MSRGISVFIVGVLMLSVASSSCKNGISKKIDAVFEKKYVSKEGNFKISFINPPKTSSEIIPYSEKNQSIPIHMFSDEVGTATYAVIYADYPAGMLKGIDANPQKVISGAKEGALNSLASSLGSYVVESQKDIEVNGYPGIIFKAKFENNLGVIYELVLVNNRLYQVRVFDEKDYPNKELADKFINSFEIVQ